MGDHLDCDGFLAQHHVWGFVAETEYTFEDDVAANVMLDSVQKICPKAKLTYLSGITNHELSGLRNNRTSQNSGR